MASRKLDTSPCMNRENLVCTSFEEVCHTAKVPGKIHLRINEADLSQLSTQASGHAIIYRLPDGKILKRSNMNEIEAYQRLQFHLSILPYIPKFYGYTELALDLKTTTRTNVADAPGKQIPFVILEDLTCDFSSPALMDIKLGRGTYDLQASAAKIKSQDARAQRTTTKKWGARVDGISCFRFATQENIQLKHECWEYSLLHSLCIYFGTGVGGEVHREICQALLRQLEALQQVLIKHSRTMNFLQSSLFFVYEADPSAPPRAKISLIDFDHAHLFPFENPDSPAEEAYKDHGCSFGISSLMTFISQLVESS